eukprot:m51a1_g11978 putative domain containing protein (1077) ;mRNA; r:848997-852887
MATAITAHPATQQPQPQPQSEPGGRRPSLGSPPRVAVEQLKRGVREELRSKVVVARAASPPRRRSNGHRQMAAGTPEEHEAAKVLQRHVRAWYIRRRWRTTVEAYKVSALSSRQRRRSKLVSDIVATERTYVRSLHILYEGFYVPMKEASAQPKPVITPEQVSKLFLNVEMIKNVNTQFLKMLEEQMSSWPQSQSLSSVFLRMVPTFKVYIEYVNRYETAIATLAALRKTKAFAEMLSAAIARVNATLADPGEQLMDLQSYLIMPIQRVPRYKLLLEELIRFTDPTHVDFESLGKALDRIKDVAETINERKRDADAASRVVELQGLVECDSGMPAPVIVQPSRRFVREGAVRKVDGWREAKNPWLVLLNDMLLFVDRHDSGRMRLRGLWSLAAVCALDPKEPISTSFQLTVQSDGRPDKTEMCVHCSSPDERAHWVADINEYKRRDNTKRSSFRISERHQNEISARMMTLADSKAHASQSKYSASLPSLPNPLMPPHTRCTSAPQPMVPVVPATPPAAPSAAPVVLFKQSDDSASAALASALSASASSCPTSYSEDDASIKSKSHRKERKHRRSSTHAGGKKERKASKSVQPRVPELPPHPNAGTPVRPAKDEPQSARERLPCPESALGSAFNTKEYEGVLQRLAAGAASGALPADLWQLLQSQASDIARAQAALGASIEAALQCAKLGEGAASAESNSNDDVVEMVAREKEAAAKAQSTRKKAEESYDSARAQLEAALKARAEADEAKRAALRDRDVLVKKLRSLDTKQRNARILSQTAESLAEELRGRCRALEAEAESANSESQRIADETTQLCHEIEGLSASLLADRKRLSELQEENARLRERRDSLAVAASELEQSREQLRDERSRQLAALSDAYAARAETKRALEDMERVAARETSAAACDSERVAALRATVERLRQETSEARAAIAAEKSAAKEAARRRAASERARDEAAESRRRRDVERHDLLVSQQRLLLELAELRAKSEALRASEARDSASADACAAELAAAGAEEQRQGAAAAEAREAAERARSCAAAARTATVDAAKSVAEMALACEGLGCKVKALSAPQQQASV